METAIQETDASAGSIMDDDNNNNNTIPAAKHSDAASNKSTSGAYLVVRIRGQADVPYWATHTMSIMKLEKKYRATIIPAKDNTLGMLNKVKHYISWTKLDVSLAREILEKKARKSGYRKVSQEDITQLGFDGLDQMADELASGESVLSNLKPLKPWFALAPPKSGFKKSTKRLAGQNGILGSNKDLDNIVRRMMTV